MYETTFPIKFKMDQIKKKEGKSRNSSVAICNSYL